MLHVALMNLSNIGIRQMSFVKAKDGTQIYFKDWGEGTPAIFIHGWPLNADMWDYQMTVLSKQGIRCIAYDRRGFGRSEQPFKGNDYDTFADDLAALIEHLKLDKVALVGFSMGGGEVARYIGKHGTGKVSKAVLVSAVTPFLLKTPDNADGVEKKVFDGMIEGIEKDRAAFFTDFGKGFYGQSIIKHPVSSEVLQWSWTMAMQGSMHATLECVRAFSETDFRKDLAKFNVPTLIIHGTSDGTVPIDASARKAVKLIPAARLIEYDGAPHGLHMTEKDKLNKDLAAFIGAGAVRKAA